MRSSLNLSHYQGNLEPQVNLAHRMMLMCLLMGPGAHRGSKSLKPDECCPSKAWLTRELTGARLGGHARSDRCEHRMMCQGASLGRQKRPCNQRRYRRPRTEVR